MHEKDLPTHEPAVMSCIDFNDLVLSISLYGSTHIGHLGTGSPSAEVGEEGSR